MPFHRRKFLATSAAATASFTIVPRHVLGGPGYVAPSDRVNVALIGAGGQGRTNCRELFKLSDVRVVAVADPIREHDLSKYYYGGKGGREVVASEIETHYRKSESEYQCKRYEDFRKLLDEEKNVDAVLCATPDHLHALVSIAAMRRKKHVYCEKPLTHNITEARRVAEVAKTTQVVTQMGNQGHSTEGMRLTVEWIRGGLIGTVKEVHAWSGTSRWNPELLGYPSDTMTIPDGVLWDHWIGPREPRPYHTALCPVSWRDFWDFGTGALGDIGCHDMDAAVWALDLHHPAVIEGRAGGKFNDQIVPHAELVYYHFEPRGSLPAITMTWYDGGLKPPTPSVLPSDYKLAGRGVMFVGEKGVVVCGGAGGMPKVYPESLESDAKAIPQSIPRVPGHHRDWIDAIKGSGKAPSSNFEYGARLTEIVLLGVAAVRFNGRLHWNAKEMKFAEEPANRFLQEGYRKGWELE
ncbi:MAG: Gfo/Idh/MocA family oxidoreductase [Pirellulales bacterium]